MVNRRAVLMLQASLLQSRLDEMRHERVGKLYGPAHNGALYDLARIEELRDSLFDLMLTAEPEVAA